MNRRKFLENVCKSATGLVVAGVAIDLSGVRSISARSRATPNPEVREIPINLIDNPDLKPIGGTYHLEIEDLERDLLVIHPAADQYVALDIKCTHKGCDLTYAKDEKQLLCPCHGSTFDLSGAVVKGPATRPLNYYHAELQGDEVMVTVYAPGEPVPANCVPPKIVAPKPAEEPADSIKIESDPFR
jgi:cytochrome b6-f complex iron-sulfur subunit